MLCWRGMRQHRRPLPGAVVRWPVGGRTQTISRSGCETRSSESYEARANGFGGGSAVARVLSGRRSWCWASRYAFGPGSIAGAGANGAAENVPQGPSHIAPMRTQPPNAMATGPNAIQSASTRRVKNRRPVIVGLIIPEGSGRVKIPPHRTRSAPLATTGPDAFAGAGDRSRIPVGANSAGPREATGQSCEASA